MALLADAADALDDMRDPFTSEWLIEHRVTLDECASLSEQMALSIRAYLAMDARDRGRAVARLLLPESVRPAFDHVVALEDARKRLTAINGDTR